MVRLLESFGAFATAQLPASHKWTTATNVAIVAGAGRSGDPSDNAAYFDTSLGSVLSGPLEVTSSGGYQTCTIGHAVRITAIAGRLTLLSLTTTNSRFDLVTNEDGALWVEQVVGGISLGTVCTTIDGVVPSVTGGTYIELRIILRAAYTKAVQIRVRDQWGQMNPLVQGALLALLAGETFTTRTFGGGTGDAAATWYVADLYQTDGVPEATALAYNGLLIYNDGYLGDTHVEAFYPTADGENLSVGNTPWVPNSGTAEFSRINEHPPDDDTSFVSANASGQRSTYVFQNPRQTSFLRFGWIGCTADAQPIYSVQWGGRFAVVDAASLSVEPVVRQIVDGTFAGDNLYTADPITIDDTDFLYYLAQLGRNPFTGEAWTFAAFYRQPTVLPGDLEFGQRFV